MTKKHGIILYAILSAASIPFIYFYWERFFSEQLLDCLNVFGGLAVIVALVYVFAEGKRSDEEKVNKHL